MSENIKTYTPQDFKSDQQIRWCPGCGDHGIISAVQKTMAGLGYKKEDIVVVSGIGCSSRFPYYMSTYGMHTIHGRAAAIATGVKLANPDLSIWVMTGDGDALAIGGNHFIHAIRRNVDMNIVLFNNEIYGLTKGQFSPTTQEGKKTKTSPFGNIETPFNPGELAIGAQGKFFARGIDINMKLNQSIFEQAAKYKGTSVVEVLQNCVIYNDGAHTLITNKANREESQLILEQGKPMLFGKDNKKGLVLDGFNLKVVTIGEDGVTEDDILVHDAFEPNPTLHNMLAAMKAPEFPVAFGVIRAVEGNTFESKLDAQIKEVQAASPIKNVTDLLNHGSTWEVE